VAYCTVDDIREQIGEVQLIQLTDDEGTGTVAEQRITRAIEDAGQEIDGYIGAGRRVPLSPVPAVIRKIATGIAAYNLYARRDLVPEARLERYRSAVHFLEQVAAGKVSLGADDPEGNPPACEAPELSGENPGRAFTRSSMAGF
jgi:phage gp36-like protein